jgi:hypothetical protein
VGSLMSSSSNGLPERPIVGNNGGKGRRGGSVVAETTTDRVRPMAMVEQGIHR